MNAVRGARSLVSWSSVKLSKLKRRQVAASTSSGAGRAFGIPAGFSKSSPALTISLLALPVLVGVGALLTPAFVPQEPTLSPRKTLALIAARASEQDSARTTPPVLALQIPAWVIEHFTAATREPVTQGAAAGPDVGPPDGSTSPLAAAATVPDEEPGLSFTGVWAANAKACTPQLNREGYLPTIINAQGAWAGETTCAFKSTRQDGRTYVVAAACSDPHKSWRTQVRLTVEGGRLTWKSPSGSRAYVRCDQGASRTRVASAQ